MCVHVNYLYVHVYVHINVYIYIYIRIYTCIMHLPTHKNRYSSYTSIDMSAIESHIC